jgi:hypothetical protein
MTPRASGWVAAVLGLVLAACGGESTGPSTGSLAVTVTGLPGGAQADVSVLGPGGFTRALTGTQTLTGLTPGPYTVSADLVTAGGDVYAGTPVSQSVIVPEGSTPAPAQVTYAVTTGSLTVTITGLPGGATASVQVTGPGGFDQTLTATTTLTGLAPGSYTVAASPVSASGSQYAPVPATQQAVVGTGGSASATVTYAEAGIAGLNYRIDGVYLTQSVQTYTGSVPLIANRDGYLRVFVTASEANLLSPDVRVRFYSAGVLVSDQTITRTGPTPLAPQEGTLSSSWNLPVPKALIQANLSLRLTVDPGNQVAETNETDNDFPSGGLPLTPEVRTASSFQVTLIPIITAVDGRVGNLNAANRDQYLAGAMRMHPLSSFNATIGGSLTVPNTVPALQHDNGNGAWNKVLNEVQARRAADGSSRYYVGVVNVGYSSGVAGIGYVGFPASLVWDKLPSAASVAAHEWGHNWGRQHAPCGDPGNPDAAYPYAGGVIGVYGLDVAAAELKPTTYHDLMGYCGNEWISDYTYRGVMQFRGAETGIASAVGQAVQPTLVVWGRIEDGRVVLEPAFQATTRPSLPARDGPYRVEARAADGSRIFGLGFAPVEVADDRQGGRHFAFTVPLSPERIARVASLRLEGEGRMVELRRSAGGMATVDATRLGAGRVVLRWDASRTPMVVVRHPRTGEILSFARGGRAEVATDEPELALSLSDRLGSRDARVRVR